MNPFGEYTCDPYSDPTCKTSPPQEMLDVATAVCGHKYYDEDCTKYTMTTYADADEAKTDSAYVTHQGSCGLCSTSQDLAAYLAHTDLTAAGKKCGIEALVSYNWGVECF